VPWENTFIANPFSAPVDMDKTTEVGGYSADL
jgi:hypothetical protein